MQTMIYRCDRCGKIAEKKFYHVRVIGFDSVTGNPAESMSEDVDGSKGKDYCEACTKAAVRFLTHAGLVEPETPGDALKIVKTVDKGKLIALRKAGWSYDQIAHEVGVAKTTVMKYIGNYEAEFGKIDTKADKARKPLEFDPVLEQRKGASVIAGMLSLGPENGKGGGGQKNE